MHSLVKLLKNIFSKRVDDGTAHWISQRVGSAALIPLTLIFLFPFIKHISLEYDQIVGLYRNPLRALLTLSFFSLTLLHFKQGAQVVIEDYFHGKANKVLLLTNSLAFWFVNLCIFIALVKIMFLT
jgi:succinate dehydrogenase / fumarate reductase membrane anchor subunit